MIVLSQTSVASSSTFSHTHSLWQIKTGRWRRWGPQPPKSWGVWNLALQAPTWHPSWNTHSMSHPQALHKWLRASGSCSYAHSGLCTTLASLGRQKQKLGLGSKLCPLSHSSGEKTGVIFLFKCPGPFFPVPHAIFISRTPPSVFNPRATKASTQSTAQLWLNCISETLLLCLAQPTQSRSYNCLRQSDVHLYVAFPSSGSFSRNKIKPNPN